MTAFINQQAFSSGRNLGVIGWKSALPEACSTMLATMALSLVVGYRRLQTLLLGWVVLFNVPIFFLVYSSGGRFYNASAVALVVASLTLLTDAGFYRKVLGRPFLSGAVVAGVLAVTLFGTQLDLFLIEWDALRYASPFLDPAASTLSVFRNDP
jgi:hypothetical protein